MGAARRGQAADKGAAQRCMTSARATPAAQQHSMVTHMRSIRILPTARGRLVDVRWPHWWWEAGQRAPAGWAGLVMRRAVETPRCKPHPVPRVRTLLRVGSVCSQIHRVTARRTTRLAC